MGRKMIGIIKAQAGHATVEWMVVMLAMMAALFVPIPGTDQSAAGLLMDSIRGFHANSSYLFSLP